MYRKYLTTSFGDIFIRTNVQLNLVGIDKKAKLRDFLTIFTEVINHLRIWDSWFYIHIYSAHVI